MNQTTKLFYLIGRQSGVGAGPACWLLELPTIWPTSLWAEISSLSGRTVQVTWDLPSSGRVMDWNLQNFYVVWSKLLFADEAKFKIYFSFLMWLWILFKRKCQYATSTFPIAGCMTIVGLLYTRKSRGIAPSSQWMYPWHSFFFSCVEVLWILIPNTFF